LPQNGVAEHSVLHEQAPQQKYKAKLVAEHSILHKQATAQKIRSGAQRAP